MGIEATISSGNKAFITSEYVTPIKKPKTHTTPTGQRVSPIQNAKSEIRTAPTQQKVSPIQNAKTAPNTEPRKIQLSPEPTNHVLTKNPSETTANTDFPNHQKGIDIPPACNHQRIISQHHRNIRDVDDNYHPVNDETDLSESITNIDQRYGKSLDELKKDLSQTLKNHQKNTEDLFNQNKSKTKIIKHLPDKSEALLQKRCHHGIANTLKSSALQQVKSRTDILRNTIEKEIEDNKSNSAFNNSLKEENLSKLKSALEKTNQESASIEEKIKNTPYPPEDASKGDGSVKNSKKNRNQNSQKDNNWNNPIVRNKHSAETANLSPTDKFISTLSSDDIKLINDTNKITSNILSQVKSEISQLNSQIQELEDSFNSGEVTHQSYPNILKSIRLNFETKMNKITNSSKADIKQLSIENSKKYHKHALTAYEDLPTGTETAKAVSIKINLQKEQDSRADDVNIGIDEFSDSMIVSVNNYLDRVNRQILSFLPQLKEKSKTEHISLSPILLNPDIQIYKTLHEIITDKWLQNIPTADKCNNLGKIFESSKKEPAPIPPTANTPSSDSRATLLDTTIGQISAATTASAISATAERTKPPLKTHPVSYYIEEIEPHKPEIVQSPDEPEAPYYIVDGGPHVHDITQSPTRQDPALKTQRLPIPEPQTPTLANAATATDDIEISGSGSGGFEIPDVETQRLKTQLQHLKSETERRLIIEISEVTNQLTRFEVLVNNKQSYNEYVFRDLTGYKAFFNSFDSIWKKLDELLASAKEENRPPSTGQVSQKDSPESNRVSLINQTKTSLEKMVKDRYDQEARERFDALENRLPPELETDKIDLKTRKLQTQLGHLRSNTEKRLVIKIAQVIGQLTRFEYLVNNKQSNNEPDFLYLTGYQYFFNSFDSTWKELDELLASAKEENRPPSPGPVSQKDSPESNRVLLIKQTKTDLEKMVKDRYDQEAKERFDALKNRLSPPLEIDTNAAAPPLEIDKIAAAPQRFKRNSATSGASRPGNFVADITMGAAAMLSRTFSPQNWFAGTGTEQKNPSLPHQEQPAIAEAPYPINNPVHGSNGTAFSASQISPAMVNITGALSTEHSKPIPGSSPFSHTSFSDQIMDNNSLSALGLLAAKLNHQKQSSVTPKDRINRGDSKLAILDNHVSHLLATTVTLMAPFLSSNTFKDLISSQSKQPLDASWTPESIMHLALVQEYSQLLGQPEALPSSFLEDVWYSEKVGINCLENFELDNDENLVFSEGKREEFIALLLRAQAREWRQSSPDKANDESIIQRAITLMDQQKAREPELFTGSDWPTDRKDQVGKMKQFLEDVTNPRDQKSLPQNPVLHELHRGNLQTAKDYFFSQPPARMIQMIEELTSIPDTCNFDHYEALDIRMIKNGLSLLDDNRKSHILKDARTDQKASEVAQEGALNQAEETVKQNAWELLVYEYQITIDAPREIISSIKLQQRLIKESGIDIGEAEELSKIIPKMLNPRNEHTLYDMSIRPGKNGIKASFEYLQYSGSGVNAKIERYKEIKNLTRSLYPEVFGSETDSQAKVISEVSLMCLQGPPTGSQKMALKDAVLKELQDIRKEMSPEGLS